MQHRRNKSKTCEKQCEWQSSPTADLTKLRARKGQSVKGSSISMVLSRWRATNRIEKINETTWRKV